MGWVGGRFPLSWASEVLEAGDAWSLEKGEAWPPVTTLAGCDSPLSSDTGRLPGELGSSVAFHSGPCPVSFPPGPVTCPVSLLVTLSTLYLLEEDPAGSQAEPALPAAPGGASETRLPLGLGPSVRVREQWPLSSLSSVLLYRTAPGDLRLVFYDEVCV